MPSAYDAVSGFSNTQNASSQWRFGYYPPNSTSFIPYSTYNSAAYPNIDGWASSSAGSAPPYVLHNKTPSTQTYPTITHPPDVLNLHPGPSGEKSVVRWTSPFAGTVAIQGRFTGLDSVGDSTDVTVKWSGNAQPLFSSYVGIANQGYNIPYSVTATVAIGDTIDFIVGYGNGYYYNDATGLAASIVKTGYDLVPDYSATQNPTGPWSYGYTASPTATTFVPYAAHAASPPAGTDTWVRDASGSTPPWVIHNNTGVAPGSWTQCPPPDVLNLHPGAAGEKSVVRWTAPFAGTISIAGRFTGLDPVGDSTDVTVKWSGNAQPLFSSYVGIANQGYNIPYSVTATVAAGDTIDFLVGYGNGYYYNDATGLAGKISFTSYPQPVAPPNAPTPSATPGNAQVSLSWNAVNTATSYTVRRSVNGAPSVIVASNLAGTSYTDTGLTNGTTYSYIVQAFNAGGGGPFSSPVNATPLAPPIAPSGLSATPGNAQVSLSWTLSARATGYSVKRATTSSGPYTPVATGVTASSYTDTGLTNSTTYYYVVSATGVGGESANSSQVSATPLTPPSAPTGLSAQAGNAQITLSWGIVANATSYQVFRSMTSNSFDALPTQTVSGTSYTDTGLSNGTTYYYIVKAVGVGGTGPASSQVSATPLAAPVAPANLSATPGDKAVALSWSPSTNATGYKLFRSTTPGTYSATPLTTLTSTSYSDTSVVNGTTYYYVVKATGIGGDSPSSGEASATPIAPPLAPTGLSATPGNAQVTLSWTASTGASSYSVLRALAAAGPFSSIATNQTGTTYTNTGLTNGTTYYYQVVAVNGSGQSGNSTTASATPQAPPNAPANLAATAGDAQVALSWTASPNATGYKVFRATSAGGYGTAPLATTANTSYSDTSAVNGTTYYYSVKATGVGGDSPFSNEVSALPVAPPAPAAPTGLSASVYNNQISLYWTASTGATSYIVRRATASAGPYTSLPATVTGTSYSNTDLAPGTTYYYRVVAVNNGGQSPESATVSATTLTPPAAPSGLMAKSGTGQVTLTWNALPNNSATYSVKRSTTLGGPYSLVTSNVYGATYTDTGLTNATTYYYVVSASNQAGTGPDSPEVSATPLAVPTLSAVGAKARVDLSWNAVAGATGYQVFRTTSTGIYDYSSPLTTTTTQTTYSDGGLTKDTPLFYVVRATVASGSSNSSAEVSARPLVPVALDLPLASTTGQGVTLSWTVNKFAGFVSYKIYRGTQTGVTPANGTLVTTITNQSTTRFFDPAPQATATGSSYFYIVVVTATSGESAASLERSVTLSTSDLQLHLSASPGEGQATLGWGYGTATNTQGVTGYGIKRATTSGGPYTLLTPSPALGANASSYTDTGLTNGTTYFYRVFPILANGNGPDSNEASVVPVRPIPTGDLVLTGAAMSGSTRLWWNASARASQYLLFRRVGVGDWSQLATVTPSDSPSYTDGGLTNGTLYSYRVRANNESGDSTDSNIVSLLPNPAPPLAPGAPTFGTTTTTSLVVNVPALPYGAASLSLYMGLSSDPAQMQPLATGLSSTSAPTVTASGLTPGVTYYFYVRAVNSFGSTPGPVASAATIPGSATSVSAPLIGSITYGVIDTGGPVPIGQAPKGHIITVYGATPLAPSQTPTNPPTLYVQWKQQGHDDSEFTQSGHDVAMSSNNGYIFYAQIKPLSPLTTYVFRFRAVDSSTSPATTTYSPTSSATTLPDPPDAPPAPSIVTGSLTDHSLEVSVPPLPSRATGLTLYWGHPVMSYDGTLEPPEVDGNYYSAQNVPSGATTVTVSNLNGGQDVRLLWGASNVTGSTYGPMTSVTTQGSGLAAPDPPAFLNPAPDSVEVIVPANVLHYQGDSLKLSLQAKTTGAPDSSYQTVLFTERWMDDSYRVSSPSGTPGINEHPEVGPLDLQRRLLVTSLTPGQSYTFRFVAYLMSSPSTTQATTQVPGAPASITLPSETLAWSSGPAIACAGIRYPWNGLSARSGQVYHLNSHSAIDWDVLTHSVSGFSWNQFTTSPCLYGWSADSGSFPEGIKGPNVLWQAPQVTVPTDVTLYLQVSDSNTDAAHVSVGNRETGVRADAPILAGDRPLQFQVTVHVNP